MEHAAQQTYPALHSPPSSLPPKVARRHVLQERPTPSDIEASDMRQKMRQPHVNNASKRRQRSGTGIKKSTLIV
jgi:hypothetical protein